MCLVLFAYKVSKEYPLVLAANRDEFYARPTAPMHFWENSPDLLAGKDIQRGGTWFGVNRSGRFAALTNFRNPSGINPSAVSRGGIILDFLNTEISVPKFGEKLKRTAAKYNGYNLLYGDLNTLFCFTNVANEIQRVVPGIHGLSNRFLDSSWPKVVKGKKALGKCLDSKPIHEKLLSLLTDREKPEDHLLPDTGVGLEWERMLSPLFIESATYGTRSSTVMTIDTRNRIQVTERTYENRVNNGHKKFQFVIQ